MNDEATIEVSCPSGGGVSATIVRSDKGTHYVRLSRVFTSRTGQAEGTGLLPASVEVLRSTTQAHAQAVVVALFEGFRAARARDGRPVDDVKALQDAVKQLPAWAQALLPTAELNAFGVQTLATQSVAS